MTFTTANSSHLLFLNVFVCFFEVIFFLPKRTKNNLSFYFLKRCRHKFIFVISKFVSKEIII